MTTWRGARALYPGAWSHRLGMTVPEKGFGVPFARPRQLRRIASRFVLLAWRLPSPPLHRTHPPGWARRRLRGGPCCDRAPLRFRMPPLPAGARFSRPISVVGGGNRGCSGGVRFLRRRGLVRVPGCPRRRGLRGLAGLRMGHLGQQGPPLDLPLLWLGPCPPELDCPPIDGGAPADVGHWVVWDPWLFLKRSHASLI